MTDPAQVRQSIEKVKHLWTKAKLNEIFELSLSLVEEFDGQHISVYETDDFARKCIPVLDAMTSQKTGKKLFLGITSNALVGIANKMNFFWWTPTRLMSRNDLQLMAAHVETLKMRLAKCDNPEENVATEDIEDEEENVAQLLNKSVIIDDFDSSDGETGDVMAQLAQIEFDKSQNQPCSSDDNGNVISNLPVPKPMTSTPHKFPEPESQKKIHQILRRSKIEESRIMRQESIQEEKPEFKLGDDEDEPEEIQPRLQLQMSFKQTQGGISYYNFIV